MVATTCFQGIVMAELTQKEQFERHTTGFVLVYQSTVEEKYDWFSRFSKFLEEKLRWKDAEKEPPKESGDYLVKVNYGDGTIITKMAYYYQLDTYWSVDGGIIFEWIEIPE